MANGYKTYEWRGNRLHEVVAKKKPKLGIQNALLLFTASSLITVFAGGALITFLCILFAVISGAIQ
ncbi:hypothetical protein [Pseudomonas koreensis]|uniref:hypothetical protein n=1 Tax=Pseudomonas koreensis TaxID=198620 RepID=UPI000FD7071A|nr:hypothetical protein [Pseudomonas koreensis]